MEENPPEAGCKHLRRVVLMLDGGLPLPTRGESTNLYWDWFFEVVRAANQYPEGLDDDLQTAVNRATSEAHKQDDDGEEDRLQERRTIEPQEAGQ